MTRRQIQPYKSELRTALDRMTRLIEKRTAEVAALKAELHARRFDKQIAFVCGAVAIELIRWLA